MGAGTIACAVIINFFDICFPPWLISHNIFAFFAIDVTEFQNATSIIIIAYFT